MNREQLMSVLIAPHVTEKTSLAMQNHNQYTFRVRRDATKTDIRKAVELMFDVKVAGVQVVNEPGKQRRFGRIAGDELAGAPISTEDNDWLAAIGSEFEVIWLAAGEGESEGAGAGGFAAMLAQIDKACGLKR